MSRRIDELPDLAALPAVQLLDRTDRLRRAFASADPKLAVHSALHAQSRASLVSAGVRTWALMYGEVGIARLPGGEASEGGAAFVTETGAADHDKVCPCGDWRNHSREGWFADVERTLLAARDRDGDAVFDRLYHAVYGAREARHTLSYAASVASSGCLAFSESGLDRAHDALLHLLGYYAVSPVHWSVAGPVYRMCSSVMTTIDMGTQFAEAVMGPEIDALARLDLRGHLAGIGLLGPAFAAILVDDPTEVLTPEQFEYEAHPAGDEFDGETTKLQEGGGRIALRIVAAYRADVPDDTTALISGLSISDRALGLFGLCNQFATRVHELWGR